MQCRNHPTENGVNTCNQCGCWLCETCSFERGGRIFCPSCATQATGEAPAHGDAYAGHHKPARTISWGLLFLFSVIFPLPGLNYMYLGLIKRGLAAMAAFFGVIYMVIHFMSSGIIPIGLMFIFAIPVLVLASIFDGFRLRNRMIAGEVVTDNIDDITAFLRRNRHVLIGFLLLLIAVNVIGGVVPWLVRVLRNIIPIIIAIWAVSLLFNKPKS
ncbi:MAG: hypothetical protein FWD03_06510 [Defluviitaleaceae bacterium]|nr:hypothetical protein [Defluviitaleaceae bacterium]